MTRSKEATRRGPGGRIEWTNAPDENGILVEPSAHDIELMGREAFLEYTSASWPRRSFAPGSLAGGGA